MSAETVPDPKHQDLDAAGLQKIEERARQQAELLDARDEALWACDEHGAIWLGNKRLLQLHGVLPGAQRCSGLQEVDSLSVVWAADKAAMDSGESSLFHFRRPRHLYLS